MSRPPLISSGAAQQPLIHLWGGGGNCYLSVKHRLIILHRFVASDLIGTLQTKRDDLVHLTPNTKVPSPKDTKSGHPLSAGVGVTTAEPEH